MPQISTISPVILTALVQQVAEGHISSASILGMIQANQPVPLGDWRVMFKKNKPGDFSVNTYQGEDGQPLTTVHAASPVEAKLLAIEAAVRQWRGLHPAPERQQ